MIRHCLFLALTLLTLTPAVQAQFTYNQADRYELGLRLRAVEVAWHEHTEADARKRAIPFLNEATRAFLFTPRAGEVGRSLDRACLALQSASDPDSALLWAEGLAVKPATRLLDTSAAELPVTLAPFYTVEGNPPEGARLRLTLYRSDSDNYLASAEAALSKLPAETKLPLKTPAEGDYLLRAEVMQGDKVLVRREQTISLARQPAERLERLRKGVQELPQEGPAVDRGTVAALLRLLTALQHQETLETDYPATRLLAETEAATRDLAAGKGYYGRPRTGQFWLTLPLRRGGVPVRLLAPEAARKSEPLPLVIALHGAGGSENLFFDAYGQGETVRLCQKRGWLLLAPRSGILDLALPLEEVVDQVSHLYPVDRKHIFLVGHSLGAVQAISAAQREPHAYAAVAALGGGTAVRASDAWADLPVFVGSGRDDPILPGSGPRLYESLRQAGAGKVTLRVYDNTEHLTIVEAALPDAFAVFDQTVGK